MVRNKLVLGAGLLFSVVEALVVNYEGLLSLDVCLLDPTFEKICFYIFISIFEISAMSFERRRGKRSFFKLASFHPGFDCYFSIWQFSN